MKKTLFLVYLLLMLVLATPRAIAANPNFRSPENVPGASTVTAEEVKKLNDEGVPLIDVRNPRLYARRHISGAHHLDLKTAFNEAALAAIAGKDDPVVIYCSGVKCSRSSRASAQAVSWGYKRVKYFRGGIVDWRNAGYPVESGATEPATNSGGQ